MARTIDQARNGTNVPVMNVIGGELAPTFGLASNTIFDLVIGGAGKALEYYGITAGTYQRRETQIAEQMVNTGNPFDVLKQILVVTQADIDWLDFYELAYVWKQNRGNISPFGGDTRDPNYLRIIGMGLRAVPCILRQLRHEMLVGEPDHWFTALWAITGENPVPEEYQGRIHEMARAWLAWGDRRGHGNAEGLGTRISASR